MRNQTGNKGEKRLCQWEKYFVVERCSTKCEQLSLSDSVALIAADEQIRFDSFQQIQFFDKYNYY